jgi:hypothetical protein
VFSHFACALPAHTAGAHGASRAADLCILLVADSASNFAGSASYEFGRQLAGTVEADDLYHTAGHKGQVRTGGTKALGRTPRGRRKPREPGRGHYDKDRPAIIVWVSRQGSVVIHAARDLTVKTVQKAADLAMQAGSMLYTDSASSYRLITGYEHDSGHHTKKEYARGDVHENRAECLLSLLKPYLRVFRGISQTNLLGYVGFFQSLGSDSSKLASAFAMVLWSLA